MRLQVFIAADGTKLRGRAAWQAASKKPGGRSAGRKGGLNKRKRRGRRK